MCLFNKFGSPSGSSFKKRCLEPTLTFINIKQKFLFQTSRNSWSCQWFRLAQDVRAGTDNFAGIDLKDLIQMDYSKY